MDFPGSYGKKTDEIVWLSAAISDPSLNKYASPDVFEQDRDRAIGTIQRNMLGEELPEKLFPKRAFGKYPDNPNSHIWSLNYETKNDDVIVDTSALLSPDLWIEERFVSAFFMSDKLVKALKKAKLTRRFSLHRCRVSKPEESQTHAS